MKNFINIILLSLIIFSNNLIKAQDPNWQVNQHNFSQNMTGFIRVKMDSVFFNAANTKIAAFVGAEIRGVVNNATIIAGQAYFPITIYSNLNSGEILNFKVYEAANEIVFMADETAIFNRGQTLGNLFMPFILTIHPLCAAPKIKCPSNQTINTELGLCGSSYNYIPEISGFPSPDLNYTLTGETMHEGAGTGSGSFFNRGLSTVKILASNNCKPKDSCTFTINVERGPFQNLRTKIYYCLLSDALNAPETMDNDTIIIEAGSYNGPVITINKNLWIQSFGGEVTLQHLTMNGIGKILNLTGSFNILNLTLANGKIHTNGNVLTAGNVTGGNPTSYIVITQGGALCRNVPKNTIVNFPIGTILGWADVNVLSNPSHTDDKLSISVADKNNLSEFTNPTPIGPRFIPLEWNVTESVKGGSNVNLAFHFSADPNNVKTGSSIVVGHNTGTWMNRATSIGGIGLFFTTTNVGPYTDFSPFGIFGCLPVCDFTGPVSVEVNTSSQYSAVDLTMSSYSWSISGNAKIIGSTTGRTVNVLSDKYPVCNGSYTLSLVVQDGIRNGCSKTCSQIISVKDGTKPILSGIPFSSTGLNGCRADALLLAPFNSNDAVQGFTDNGMGPLTASLVSTEVTGSVCDWTIKYNYNVADACGNVLSGLSYSNFGKELTPPVFTNCPSNINHLIAGNFCGQNILYSISAQDMCGGIVNIKQTDATGLTTGSLFPVGITLQEYEATDVCGNKSTCSFEVSIRESIKPIINCPVLTGIILAPGECGQIINYVNPFASDNCDPSPDVIQTDMTGLHSGSFFPKGFHCLTYVASDLSGNTTECTFCVNITGVGVPAKEIACNDNIHFSLNEDCKLTLTADIILKAGTLCNDDYIVEVRNASGGSLIDRDIHLSGIQLDHRDIGKQLIVNIIDKRNGNRCWGKITVEDKFAPILECGSDTLNCRDSYTPAVLGFPVPLYFINVFITQDPKDPNSYNVENWDACSQVRLHYYDEIQNFGCDSIFRQVILRHWVAIDAAGNKSMCEDTIFVYRSNFGDLMTPPDFDGVDRPMIKCNDNYPKLSNGNPDPIFTGFVVPLGCNELVSSYADLKINICENTYKILRRWVVIDWCTKEVREIDQVIKIVDDNAPVFTVPAQIFLTVKTYTCESFGKLPIPEIITECGRWSYQVFTQQKDSLGNYSPISSDFVVYNPNEKIYYLDGAPLGKMKIIYEVMDDCGNISTTQIDVIVEDLLLPVPVCDERTVVTLSNDGTAVVLAETFDNGSLDNCGILDFKVRRMGDPCFNGTNQFGNDVEFCCSDVGDTIMVELKVIDDSRNENSCMVEIIVQEKESPNIIPPTDITISCTHDLTDLSKFGIIRYVESERKNIIIVDANYYMGPNYIAGKDGLATDNCFVEVTEQVSSNLVCNQGTITRTFVAKDKQGLVATATQTIFVRNPQVFNSLNITWPLDKPLNSCRITELDPSVAGSPIYSNIACANLAANYEDMVLNNVDSTCVKVLRKWTVLDWCQFNAQTNAGVFTHVQIIYITNSESPMFLSCNDIDLCDSNGYHDPLRNACMIVYDIKAEAEDDCTKTELLKWSYRLDVDNDGIFEPTVYPGNRAQGEAPVGIWRIQWTVQDQCHNSNTCIQKVTMKDCKKPTPVCYTGITTVIMPTNGTVAVWAKDLDAKSFDNCTQKDKLKFSFSEDVNHTSITYNCDSMNKQTSITKVVRIYVTDEYGNSDFCETTIVIQDNNKACEKNLINISGLIQRADGQRMPYAEVIMLNDSNQIIQKSLTTREGEYSFISIPNALNYKIKADKADDILSGVSTYDIVLIQKSILGKQAFTSPYQFLAADLNNSKSITSRDISDLRKVILGLNNEFPCKTIWEFTPAKNTFIDSTSPWEAKNQIDFKEYLIESNKQDMVAYKKGDIDNSAFLGFQDIQKRKEQHIWSIGKETVSSHNTFIYPVHSKSEMMVEGFQLSLLSSGIISVISAKIDISASNYFISSDRLKMSWNSESAKNVLENEILFYLEFSKPIIDFKMSDPKEFVSEVYTDIESSDLFLNRLDKEQGDFIFDLGQNIPNPYSDKTTIPIRVSKASIMILSIYDLTGKVVLEKNLVLDKGLNYITIDKSSLGSQGIYLYKIQGDAGTQIRKMLLK